MGRHHGVADSGSTARRAPTSPAKRYQYITKLEGDRERNREKGMVTGED